VSRETARRCFSVCVGPERRGTTPDRCQVFWHRIAATPSRCRRHRNHHHVSHTGGKGNPQMSDNIFDDGFLGRSYPAWHKLGNVFAEHLKITASQAFEMADLLYEFIKVPLEVLLPSGDRVAVPQVAVMREPTHDDQQWRLMSIVEPDFGIIQHRDLARQL